MILQKLRELANDEVLLKNPDYEPKPVAWIITVGSDGRFLGLTPTLSEQPGKKKPQAKTLMIPRRAGKTSAAVADFLVDKSEYVLGVEPDNKRSAEDLATRRGLFAESVGNARHETVNSGLAAVHEFLNSERERESCIAELNGLGYKSNDLFAFEYEGRFVHDAPEVQAYFSRLRRDPSAATTQCLVCGRNAAPVDKHPGVKLPGGTTSGVALVSFNCSAFESYGWSRNENAPVCRDCADAYTTALNRLLSDRYPDPRHPGEVLPRRSVRLSDDTTAVFWAEEGSEAVDLFSSLFDRPTPEAVHNLLLAAKKGTAPAPIPPRFYCVILSGAQGRAILRNVHIGMLAEVEANVREYFALIGEDRPLPLFLLLRSLAVQRKAENLPPHIAGDLFLAILFGLRFPRAVLSMAVQRCRAERSVPRERAALLRAYFHHNEKTLEVTLSLDRDNASAGYRLGRLLAALERLQAEAQGNPNKTIVDRYYGAASTRPLTVFPGLLKLAQHHAAKLKTARFHQARLEEILTGVAAFPPTLSLEEQGMFALGYYHQREESFKKRDAAPVEDAASTQAMEAGVTA